MMTSAPKSVHYRTFKQACNYCSALPTIVRATVTDDGSVYVATLCKSCAEGEVETQCKGWDNPEGTSDFYRPANGETPLP